MCHIETESENEYVEIKSNRDRSGKYVVADSTGYRVSDEESKRLQLNSAAETVAPLNSPPTATRLLSFFDCRKTLSQIMIYLHFLAYDWNEDVTESRKKEEVVFLGAVEVSWKKINYREPFRNCTLSFTCYYFHF